MSYKLYNSISRSFAITPGQDGAGRFLQYENGTKQYFLSIAITSGSTTTTAVVGSFAVTINATGLGKIFVSRNSSGLKWFEVTGAGGGGGGAVDSVNGQTGTVTLTTEEVSDSVSTKKYVTAAEKTKLSNLSGTNSGDETITTIKSKLGITTLSGSNTGDQDLSTYATKTGTETLTNKTINASSNTISNIPQSSVTGLSSALSTYLVKTNNLSDISTPATARTNLGLGNVDNTADINKRVEGVADLSVVSWLLGLIKIKSDGTRAMIGTGTGTASEFAIASTEGSSGKDILRRNTANTAFEVVSPQTIATDMQSTGLVADAVGFRNIPSNSKSVDYTLVAADSGKSVDHPASDASTRTYTIPSNASVAYPIGTCLTFSNMTSQAVSIAITSDTMYLAGAGTTGTRTLAQYGVATARKLTSTTWLISGINLT